MAAVLKADSVASVDHSFPAVFVSALNNAGLSFLNSSQYSVFPGFCDVHVHFREPGFSYKETIRSGSLAAARGGYTDVCTMPNLSPVPDCTEHLAIQQDLIKKDSCIHIHPYGAITVGQKGEVLSDMTGMSESVIAFSDDGRGIQDAGLMREAMEHARVLNKMIVAHCEDNSLLRGGYIHDGLYAAAHGHRGICSESEWKQIERDLSLAKDTGCVYHVCHISTKESVEIIRDAQKDGVDVSCETGPHYLLMDENDLQEDGRFKMNPPLRGRADRDALLEGLSDGTIDMIATDHAPHSIQEKSRGLENSSFGIVGIETAFPLLYTYLVKTGAIDLNRLIQLLTINPRNRFHIDWQLQDFSVWDLQRISEINPEDFLSMGKSTPFAGWQISGKCLATFCGGKPVYRSI